MPALSIPILIEQGATFTIQTRVEVGTGTLDLLAAGYSARFVVNKNRLPLVFPFLDLSTTNGGNEIVFSAGGLITVTASAAQTSAIKTVRGRTYRYSLNLTAPDGTVFPLLKGRAVINPSLVPGSSVGFVLTTELTESIGG